MSQKGDVFVDEMYSVTVKRFSCQEPSSTEQYSLPEVRLHVNQVSPTGRYLLLYNGLDKNANILYDTTFKEYFKIPPSEYYGSKSIFKFSEDENKLSGFLMQLLYLNIVVLDLSDGIPKIRSCGKRILDGVGFGSGQLAICIKENIGWIIKAGRIYKMDLSTLEIVFPKGLVDQGFECSSRNFSSISSDGSTLSVLRYGTSKAQIQTFNLNAPKKPVHCLDLDWHLHDLMNPTIKFSRDLEVLICGMHIFHLAAEDHRLASKPFSIAPTGGLEGALGFYNHHRCFIDRDNPFVAYVSLVANKPLFLYRINLRSRDSVQLCRHLGHSWLIYLQE